MDALIGNNHMQHGLGITILLCEDEPLIRMCTADVLDEMGFQVVEAGDAAGALQILSTRPVDVLITDVGLPDMSGVVLAQRAREMIRDIPVIFVTGELHVPAFELDVRTRLIIKPYVAQDLQKAALSFFTADPLRTPQD